MQGQGRDFGAEAKQADRQKSASINYNHVLTPPPPTLPMFKSFYSTKFNFPSYTLPFLKNELL